jgi:hypothetical protein
MLPKLLLYSTLLTPILALPTTIIGQWTLAGVRRTCSPTENRCTMAFSLDENRGPEDKVSCVFDFEGHAESDFGSRPCGDRFLVQGGWNTTAGKPEESFLTLVVTDKKINAYGFFGVREQEFGQFGMVNTPITRPAYTVGEFGLEPEGSDWDSNPDSEVDYDSDWDNDEDSDSGSDEERLAKRQDPTLVQVSNLRRCESYPICGL